MRAGPHQLPCSSRSSIEGNGNAPSRRGLCEVSWVRYGEGILRNLKKCCEAGLRLPYTPDTIARMALMEKKRHGGRRTRKRTFKRRRRTGLWVFIVLVVLTLGATILYGTSFLTSQTEENVVQVEDPTIDEAPEIVGEEGTDESTEEDEDEKAPTPPDDPTMFLSVPKLGIVDALVLGGHFAHHR